MEFLDRTDEKARLARFLAMEEGATACLYGRRRIGKSRLLDEVLGGRRDVVLYCADRSEAALQRARMAEDLSRLLPGFAGVSYRDWRSLFERWQREAPPKSALVIDELPYLVETSPELPSVLQRIADGLRKSGQKLILCGSSQRMMQGLVLDSSEPLYGRCRVLLKLGPISYPWLKRAFPRATPLGRLERYAVWGGVPRYWEVCQGESSLWATLRDEVFSPNGLFHDEPSYVLKDDLEGAAQAASVLSLIGQGTERPSEMAGRLQVPQTALGRPLKRLMELGLVMRDIPFGRDAKGNKKSLYRLADPFLRFWYTFALPRYSNPRFLSEKDDLKLIRKPFRVFLGQAWESLVRDTLARKAIPGLAIRWGRVGRWWGTGLNRAPMEIDVVAESMDGRTLLVGEAKLALTAREALHAKAELDAKARLLPFAARYDTILTRLFVAEGGVRDGIDLSWCEADDAACDRDITREPAPLSDRRV